MPLKVDFKLHLRDQQTVDLLKNGNDPPLLKTGYIYKIPFNCLLASECLDNSEHRFTKVRELLTLTVICLDPKKR